MNLYACITAERDEKTRRLMQSLVEGWREPAFLVEGWQPPAGQLFAVWGQIWRALEMIPRALRKGSPFLHVDNGYYRSARGGRFGYYRITYNGMSPVELKDPPKVRHPLLDPYRHSWRKRGRHVLIALPGPEYGRAIGLDMMPWINTISNEVRKYTDREIIVRNRFDTMPLERDLDNCWAVVTHTSNVAVDAVLAGIPVFVAPTNPAAPVGNLDLSRLENPLMPDRDVWWQSLMTQQFTVDEMADGTAYIVLQDVIRTAHNRVSEVTGLHLPDWRRMHV